MMKVFVRLMVVIFFALAALAACRKPYFPDAIANPQSYLVVEGTISTNDITTIRLSRAVRLDKSTANPVLLAKLVIESATGTKYNLTETGGGAYQLTGTVLDNPGKYRLRITTADNKEYLSDFEQAKNTPGIDSVGFTVSSDKVKLYVSSHDPANNTRYYRFDYDETWRFHVAYDARWTYSDMAVRPRTPEEDTYYCFTNDVSTTIVLGSTAKLTQDVLYQQPLGQIESSSEKIMLRYSMLVREYSLSEKEYQFWQNLKKNTEQLGGIFDAQPTELSGNIHNSADPSEIVIGYVGAGKVTSKRIFIGREQLPPEWSTKSPYDCYPLDTLWYKNPKSGEDQVKKFISIGYYLPVEAFYKGGFSPAGFLATPQVPCIDCTIRGVLKQPDFWR